MRLLGDAHSLKPYQFIMLLALVHYPGGGSSPSLPIPWPWTRSAWPQAALAMAQLATTPRTRCVDVATLASAVLVADQGPQP
jgi:hypothetical protein